MTPVREYEHRYKLANELHARPFPVLKAPCRAAFIAFRQPVKPAFRDRAADRAHLIALLDRFGSDHPKPEATHYFGRLGKHNLKWESHTEFTTYTIFADGVADTPFNAETFNMLPADWLEAAPGERMTSALVRVEDAEDFSTIPEKLLDWFVPESLAASQVLDGEAVMASDFRIDAGGHIRLALFVKPEMGQQRTGRVVQRLCEIETYKTASMLGLMDVRELSPRMADIDTALTGLMEDMRRDDARAEHTLKSLLGVATELETYLAQSTFRFGATRAYARIVNQRIEVLRESRLGGRQTLAEFMMRRFDPAMRTVEATEERLNGMADRAERAANLLRTQVDVERSAQNQKVLESMDRRADLQLRLQRTVEGLSVVAISYYAVSLALYLLGPLEDVLGVSKAVLAAVTTPVVVLLVWGMVRRIRRALE